MREKEAPTTALAANLAITSGTYGDPTTLSQLIIYNDDETLPLKASTYIIEFSKFRLVG